MSSLTRKRVLEALQDGGKLVPPFGGVQHGRWRIHEAHGYTWKCNQSVVDRLKEEGLIRLKAEPPAPEEWVNVFERGDPAGALPRHTMGPRGPYRPRATSSSGA